jgi:8-oxo-dGTP pyrophosphatase MutT (NUDIX family)
LIAKIPISGGKEVPLEPVYHNGKEITEEKISSLLDQYRHSGLPVSNRHLLRQAAVLVPLLQIRGDWHLLFTRRTETVLNHKGQVAFPGGAVEPDDPDVEFAALRETHEEIGLAPERVKILGRMPDYATVSDFLISPVVGRVPWPFDMVLSSEEVVHAFTIPLRWLATSANWEEKPFVRPDGRQEQVIYYKTYSGELLWGITARITLNFLQILGLR